MREVEVGGRHDRRRADRVHDALGVRPDVRRRRSAPVSTSHLDAEPLRLARHAWARRLAARSLFRHRAQAPTRSRISRARARRTAIAVSAARQAHLRTLRDSFHPRDRRPGPVGLATRVGLSRLARSHADIAVHDAVARARAIFPRSAAAPAVRPLRHLLRLVAVPGAGDADAGRPCRARGRLDRRGGMARLAEALAELARARGAELRFRQRVARIVVENGRAAGVETDEGERDSGRRRHLERRRRRARRRKRGARGGARRRRNPAGRALAVGPDLGDDGARRGLSARPPQRVLFARLRGRIRRHLRASRLPGDPTVYVCAQDRDEAASPAESRAEERLFCLVNAPTRPADRPLTDAEMESCEEICVPAAGAMRPEDHQEPGLDASNDAGGFRPPLSVDARGALRPGDARMEGVVRAAGIARPGFRAFIWRGAASIRDRECRWRRCRAVRRRCG